MLHYVSAFESDLVVVTFVTDDIFRKLRFVNVPYSTGRRDQDLRAYIDSYLAEINWLRPYPELFAATLGPYFGMQTRLPLDPLLVLASPRGRYCMSSEHFGQLAWQFKRMSGSSGLKVQAVIAC